MIIEKITGNSVLFKWVYDNNIDVQRCRKWLKDNNIEGAELKIQDDHWAVCFDSEEHRIAMLLLI